MRLVPALPLALQNPLQHVVGGVGGDARELGGAAAAALRRHVLGGRATRASGERAGAPGRGGGREEEESEAFYQQKLRVCFSVERKETQMHEIQLFYNFLQVWWAELIN